MSIFHNNALLNASGNQGGAYVIERSLRFVNSDSANLSRTFGSGGNRRTWTWSGWIKRTKLGTGKYSLFGGSGTNSMIRFNNDNGGDGLRVLDAATGGYDLITNRAFRDISAWYHIVVAVDTTQSTESDRVKIYVNGAEETSLATSNYPTQNAQLTFNNNISHTIGNAPGSIYYDGLMTEIHFVDGQALAPTDFGEYSEDYPDVWNPIEYTGSHGTTGFHLNFSDNTSTSTIAEDQSGNGNDFTANNISVSGTGTDSFVDSPSMGEQTDTGAGGEVSGNYATFNGLDSGNVTLSNGLLSANANIDDNVRGTLHIPEDVKIYFEFTVDQRGGGGSQSPIVGVCLNDLKMTQNADAQGSKVWAYAATGNKLGGGSQYASHGDSLSADDVLGVAVDRANGRIWFSKNGTWQNSSDPTDGSDSNAAFTNVPTTGILCFFYGNNNSTAGHGTLNCGQRAFSYNAPTDYKVLCTTSFNDSTIMDGGEYHNTVLYTGVETADTAITGFGFSPDFVWIKERSDSENHFLYDTIRGVRKSLTSIDNSAQNNYSDTLESFDSDGFTLGDSGFINSNGETYASWGWDAASTTDTNNTDGSITPSGVRANTTSGFSIVTYRGTGSNATVGHGMGKVPSMYWVKRYSHQENWMVYHKSLGATKYMNLNTDGQVTTQSNIWNDTEPTSSVFSIGTNSQVNEGNDTYDYVAYLFAEVEGYSAFGSYQGNGAANGPFIYTGFKPAWIIYKTTDTGGANSAAADWFIRDYRRLGFNHCTDASNNPELEANENDQENNNGPLDICCNGFKIKNNNPGHNQFPKNFIYMAFAQHPVKIARAR